MKRIAKQKGKEGDQYCLEVKTFTWSYPLQSQKADVDLHHTHQWLRSAGLRKETEGFIVATQDQSLHKKLSG